MAHPSFGNPGVARDNLRTIEGVAGLPARVRAEVHVIHQHLADGLSRIRREAGLSPLESAGGYNYRKIAGSSSWSNHCLTGDTLVMTVDGPRKIEDLASQGEARLLTRHSSSSGLRGTWVDAPVTSYGVEGVSRITLSRYQETKEITATPAHRWILEDGSEVRTADLQPGMRLANVLPRHATRVRPSPFGVIAGAGFGDGTINGDGSGRVTLWGEKVELMAFFPAGIATSPRVLDSGVTGVEVRGLSRTIKALPSLDEGPGYLAGWLIGYLATDGHVRSDEVRLSSRNREDLEFAALIAQRLGIATNPIKMQATSGGYKPGDQYSLSFVTYTIPDWLLVRRSHIDAFSPSGKRPAAWKVKSVVEAGRAEVFCASVEGTGTFALDGGILTGNSYGLAVDYNAGTNPHSYRRIVDFPVPAVRELLADLPGMRWGLDFRKPDPMHFEWVGSVPDAKALTARLEAGGGQSVTRQEQAVLAEWGLYAGGIDGKYGPLTAKARAAWAAGGHAGRPGDWTAGLPEVGGGHTIQSSTVAGVGLTLLPGDELRGDGHHLTVQRDGVVAMYHTATDEVVWVMPGVARLLALQADGNLVAYIRDVPMWWSGTQTTPHEAAGTILAPQSDGNLVIYRAGRAVWSSRYGIA